MTIICLVFGDTTPFGYMIIYDGIYSKCMKSADDEIKDKCKLIQIIIGCIMLMMIRANHPKCWDLQNASGLIYPSLQSRAIVNIFSVAFLSLLTKV
jgi:hypothetical protein